MNTNKEAQTYLFFGMVGSGKGTQVNLLRDYLLKQNIVNDILYVSTGEEFRKHMANGDYFGQIIDQSMKAGNLQPDFVTNSLFTGRLINDLKEDSCLIIDGFPRTPNQAKLFDEVMNFFNRKNISFIFIDVSFEEAKRRMIERNRHDDTEEGIKRRFIDHTENVIPTMDFFKNKKNYSIYHINGEQTPDLVHEEIIKSLNI